MDPVATFDAQRPRLVSLAYRMLGTPDDADDVVQDAWLRWADVDHDSIDNPAAWLTSVTTRLAIDRLRSARHRRETYVGPWLPEPIAVDVDPADLTAAAETLTLGFLTVLERLAPVERAVFLLHDVFGIPFAEVATTVGRSEPATRQLASRARRRVRDEARADAVPAEQARALADAFLGAVIGGDLDALQRLLTDDVVHVSDGGPDRRAARRPVVGPHRVSRLLVNLASRIGPGFEIHPVDVNGQPGWLALDDGAPTQVLVPSFLDGRVHRIFAVLNPAKLRRFHEHWLAARG